MKVDGINVNKQVRYSIIIPNLNSTVIDQTLDALLPQCQNSSAEILVIGLDEPGLIKESAWVRFISTGVPVVPAIARNIGIRMARGEILCFLDADCIPCSDWLERIEQWFDNRNVAVLGGGVDTSERGFWAVADHISSFHDYLVSSRTGTRQQLPSLNLMIRKSAIERVGLFDECRPIGEDSDLTTRLRLAGYILHFDPQIKVNHMPNRRTAREVLTHARKHGYYSIKVDPQWRVALKPSFPLRHRPLLLVGAPLLAFGVVLNIYRADRALWRWYYVAPAIFVLKWVWCLGAADGTRGFPSLQKNGIGAL